MSFELIQRLESLPQEQLNMFSSSQPHSGHPLLDKAGVRLGYESDAAINDVTINTSYQRLIKNADSLRVIALQGLHFISYGKDPVDEIYKQWSEWSQNPKAAYSRIGRATVAWWNLSDDVIWSKNPRVAENIHGAVIDLAPKPIALAA